MATTSPRAVATGIVRLAVVVLVVSAETYLVVQVGDAFVPSNHYSYFTVLSNVFGALVCAWSLVGRAPTAVRGAAVTFLALTGVVYNTMLRGVDVQTDGYPNLILHVVVPILMVIEWVLAPPTEKIRWRTVAAWMVVPLGYLAYTLIRGPIVDWYPYPFLDPRPSGYGTVVVGSIAVAVAFFLAASVVALLGNALRGGGRSDGGRRR